jgi:cell division protein FtsB
MWKKVIRILLNKYLLTTVAVLVWLFFFDSNNVLVRIKLGKQLKELQQQKQFYMDEIREDSILNRELLSDTAVLERYAREKYLMKRENEDVFLVIDTATVVKPGLHPQSP